VLNAFRRGGVDGVITIPAALFGSTRVADVARFHLDAPLGQFSIALLMTKDRHAALSAAVKTALAENTGEPLVRAWALDHDRQDAAARDRLDTLGHVMTRLSATEGKRWQSAVDSHVKNWIDMDSRRRLAYEAARKLISTETQAVVGK
jgi:TRAP-type C4-dicarboxylate transport system substrate-binding protein